MKTCYIFGAAEGIPEKININNSDLVIAADAGIKHLKNLNLSPDIAVGDFDSLGYVPNCKKVIKHPEVKDDTDMMLAVKIGLENNYTRFLIYGGTGNRPDHTFANIQTLAYIASKGGIGFLSFGKFTATVINNASICFNKNAKGMISVFSLGKKAKGVNLNGLLYELNNASLKSDFPLGISNKFLNKEAKISVLNGSLLIIWEGNHELLA